jgi:predicted nucleic acid-binding protein
MKKTVLWDSSAVLALLDADDTDHERAVGIADQIADEGRPCFITNYIEAEAHALLLRKLGRALAREWLLAGGLPVVRVTQREEETAKEILTRYADKNWSLCDAISFAVIDSRGVGAAFSFDQHFTQYGRFRVLGFPSSHV